MKLKSKIIFLNTTSFIFNFNYGTYTYSNNKRKLLVTNFQ